MSSEVSKIQAGIEGQIEALWQSKEDLMLQCNVNTATWGIVLWERMYGIASNNLLGIEQRKEQIKSRMRGVGTVTTKMIKNVAEAYSQGEVEVLEQVGQYVLTIRFINTYGVPANVKDMMESINRIKPAHLVAQYVFLYAVLNQYGEYQFADLKDYSLKPLNDGLPLEEK